MNGQVVLILILLCVMGAWFYEDVQRYGADDAITDLTTGIIVGCVLVLCFYLLIGYPP